MSERRIDPVFGLVAVIALAASGLAFSISSSLAVAASDEEIRVVFVDGGATGVPNASTQALMDVVSGFADGNSWAVEHRNRSTGSTDMIGVDVVWVPDQFGTGGLDRWVGLDVPTLWSHEKVGDWSAPVVDEDYATGWYNEYTPYDSTYPLELAHAVPASLGWSTDLDAQGRPINGERQFLTETNWHFSYLRSQLGPGADLVMLYYPDPPDSPYTESTAFVAAAAYEPGAEMANGTVAQARRLLFGLNRYAHPALSAEGGEFARGALTWLADAATSPTPDHDGADDLEW